MNSNIFDFKRFGRYFVTDIRNAISNFGISFLAMSTLSLSFDIVKGFYSILTNGTWNGIPNYARISLFAVAAVVIILLSPSKIYGFVTEKKAGQAFLMLPVSTLEKSISMILISCIIVPLVFIMVFLSIDFLVCLADPTCGNAIMVMISELDFDMLNGFSSKLAELAPFIDNPSAYTNVAWLIDDAIQIPLVFLLGAVFFKRSKPAKTLASIIMIGIVLSLIGSALVSTGLMDSIQDFSMSVQDGTVSVTDFPEYFPVISWTINHLILLDTVSDTLMNLFLCFLIWLRIKKMNH